MAYPTTARLVDSTGSEVLRFDRATLGVIINSLDLGWPDVRTDVVSRSAMDGTIDSTSYIGARTITAELTLPDSGFYNVEDQLRQVMHPNLRYWLYVYRDGWASERRILVRGSTFTPTMSWPKHAQLVWVAPEGTLQEPQVTVTLMPSESGASGGISLPAPFPISLSPGVAPGVAVIYVTGTAPTFPVVDIYGPCTNPVLFLGSQALTFRLSIATGDYLHVDFGSRTALLNSDPTLSKYGTLDFLNSVWWSLEPGSQQVAFAPASAGGACQAVFSWSPRWI